MIERNAREWEEIYPSTIQFTDDLYKEYNEIKNTTDYVDGEVVLSRDGSTVAVKGTDESGNNFYAVYESDTDRSQWLYVFPIDQTNRQTIPGSSISLSKDGRGTAVGGLQCNPDLEVTAGVICYDFDTRQGPNFDPNNDVGEDWGDSFGTSVSLNDEATLLAVGSSRGRVYVYNAATITLLGKLDEARIGNYIDVGNRPGSTFGEIVKVVGTKAQPTVFVGGTGDKIAAYTYSTDNGTWRKRGNDIQGVGGGAAFDVADNGIVAAIRSQDRFVRVYEYVRNQDGSADWEQRGQDIDAGTGRLASLSISGDGNILAVGSYNGDGATATRSGFVNMYEFVGNNWERYSVNIEETTPVAGVDFGRSVSLSEDGRILAVSAPAFSSTVVKRKGYVAIFEVGDPFPSVAPMKLPTSIPTSPPSSEPSRSNKPSSKPVTPPSAIPTITVSEYPTFSVAPSVSPTRSRPPTLLPTPFPTASTCLKNCVCKEGSECDMSECRYNCSCEGGFCDMRKCEYDCRCKGGNCNMNRCGSNCQCEMRGCQMDNCIYNSNCVKESYGKQTNGSSGRNVSLRVSILGLVLVTVVVFI